MANKNKPLNVKLHTAQKAMSNAEMEVLKEKGSLQAQKLAHAQRLKIEAKQDEIDRYNSVTCNNIDPFFEGLQLTGKDVIIRLHKENYIKGISKYTDGVPLYDAWISQVDGRMHASEQPKWMDNPLPYVFTGVVVAIAPSIKADYVKEAARVKELTGEDMQVLSVGDIVHLEHFMFADKRFYINKQKRDFIKNPTEYRVKNWKGYVKVHPSMIEGIVTDKESFLSETSAYARYKETGIIEDTKLF
jgi:hypothetical protein